MKNIIIPMLCLAISLPHFAMANIPAFPMTFWGDVTIDGSAAPAGTIIRAYYGEKLAGEVEVGTAGIYGYNNPTKQRLLVSEGQGEIIFKMISPQHNAGQETSGLEIVSFGGFESGQTIEKDLSFKFTTTNNSGGGSSSGGGGGGGGGGSRNTTSTPANTNLLQATTPSTTIPVVLGASTEREQLEQLLRQVLTELIKRLQLLIAERSNSQ